jgi:hypothetical protein
VLCPLPPLCPVACTLSPDPVPCPLSPPYSAFVFTVEGVLRS